jgi:hypothetical protein
MSGDLGHRWAGKIRVESRESLLLFYMQHLNWTRLKFMGRMVWKEDKDGGLRSCSTVSVERRACEALRQGRRLSNLLKCAGKEEWLVFRIVLWRSSGRHTHVNTNTNKPTHGEREGSSADFDSLHQRGSRSAKI